MKYLITGGTGFLGSRLIERLLEQEVCKIVTVARNEGKLIMLKEKFSQIDIVTGDISKEFVCQSLFEKYRFDGVFHLSAFKHVGMAEHQAIECLESNITGTINVLKYAKDVDFVLGISTDKAAQVNGVYGLSKLAMERLFKNFEEFRPNIKYRIVRYGNVLYSTGSVLCKWKDLIQQDKEIIVTDSNATRFFWTRDSAIDLIFDCLENANDSTPYCPKMKSIEIADLIIAMYEKYGVNEIKIKKIGLQVGENLHETIDGKIFSNEVEQYTIDEIKEMI
jgi:UDP-N-acetylglucosamine 4,6-dehydratase/UDP-glucose 4-epimerase